MPITTCLPETRVRVSHAIRRQLEALATLAVAVDGIDAVKVSQLHFQLIDIGVVGQVDHDVRNPARRDARRKGR